jgi:hypothetical protein
VAGNDGQFEFVIWSPGRIAEPMPPREELELALAIFDAACERGDARKLGMALSEMAIKTKRRAEDAEDHHAMIQAYLGSLMAYPGDVALAAIKRCTDNDRWFPAWADLRRECDRLGSKRMAARETLRRALA